MVIKSATKLKTIEVNKILTFSIVLQRYPKPQNEILQNKFETRCEGMMLDLMFLALEGSVEICPSWNLNSTKKLIINRINR